ncbi:DUF3231 family protein [Bacillus marasmi]|uniref:DUF3231 family protein n=1 Tax=Bacillus marasmi TaxID=1926279 RepID=UPI0011CA12C2|nr:DUF3231 family protein [Bacillus marasmi]
MKNQNNIALTSSELGYLWTGYSINEMSVWYLTIFSEHANDNDIKELFNFAIGIARKLLAKRGEILSQEGYPLPKGFSETDINPTAPLIFTDRFLLSYLLIGARLGLEFHVRSLAYATREDVRKYHSGCVDDAIQLNDRVVELMLNKGVYWRQPTLPAPTAHEKIQKTSYLDGWIGDTRPLNSLEIANLYSILELLLMIETICTGFAQTTSTTDIEEVFLKGGNLAKNQYHALYDLLSNDNLPIPPSHTAELTDSKVRIFSDRIMVCHLAGLFGSLLSQYGFALGSVMKHDLLTTYTALISKAGSFAEKITRLLINKEWLEKVPGAISRE